VALSIKEKREYVVFLWMQIVNKKQTSKNDFFLVMFRALRKYVSTGAVHVCNPSTPEDSEFVASLS
jgi:hypothetical protein